MANLHEYFLHFDNRLNLTPTKLKKLKISESNIKRNIKKHFTKYPNLKFTMVRQGSYALGTMIRTKDDYCDIDFGLRFFPFPALQPMTLQRYVKDGLATVKNTTLPVCKKKCVRLEYKGDYHLDITVYGLEGFSTSPLLATKDGWEESDPSKFKKWFEEKGGKNLPQLRRIVKYTKAWGDFKGNGFLKGIAITILVADNFVPKNRDEISLRETITKIAKNLEEEWVCIKPVSPYEDLFEGLTENHEEFLLRKLNYFVRDADIATAKNMDSRQAWVLWKRHLGVYF